MDELANERGPNSIDYTGMLDAMAETIRQEADNNKDAAQRKTLWAVVAGLEIAASTSRELAKSGESVTAAQLVEKFKKTHYAHLLKKETPSFRRKPPKLYVKRVIKGGRKKSG